MSKRNLHGSGEPIVLTYQTGQEPPDFASGATITVSADDIISVHTISGGSEVRFRKVYGQDKGRFVETPAAIAAIDPVIYGITPVDRRNVAGTPYWINLQNYVRLQDSPAALTNAGVTIVMSPLYGKYPLHATVARATLEAAIATAGPFGNFLPDAVTTGITAYATGGQANATQLVAGFNNVTTCATAHDSVKLPAAVVDGFCVVKNSGATGLDVFPSTGDNIDALAGNNAITIWPGSTSTFRAIDGTTWESTADVSITLNSPAVTSGQLRVQAANSAGNFVTTLTNASQAASRTYTVPDAGANAIFAMTEGTQTINGAKTMGSDLTIADGTVGSPGVKTTTTGHGIYELSATQMGLSVAGALTAMVDTSGLSADRLTARVALGTAAAGTTVVEYSDGANVVTEITLVSTTIAIAGAANEGNGVLVYTFPAGKHGHTYSSHDVVLQGTGTVDADTPEVGVGSVVATGPVALLSTATWKDYINAVNAPDCNGTAMDVGPVGATAGVNTGISLNKTGDVKAVYLNVASAWAGADTITVTGTIKLTWSIM